MTLGHTVLAVPVPALEEVVRERTAFYDASFLSADPGFVHAHITLLAPWADQPTAAELAQVAHIARAAGPFDVKLAQVGEFPDGVLYLRPYPDGLQAAAQLAARVKDRLRPPPLGSSERSGSYMEVLMKKLVELLLCILHPLAVVLMWINLASRRDLGTGSKLAWAIFGLIPLVPFLYVLTGGDLF